MRAPHKHTLAVLCTVWCISLDQQITEHTSALGPGLVLQSFLEPDVEIDGKKKLKDASSFKWCVEVLRHGKARRQVRMTLGLTRRLIASSSSSIFHKFWVGWDFTIPAVTVLKSIWDSNHPLLLMFSIVECINPLISPTKEKEPPQHSWKCSVLTHSCMLCQLKH